jgi:deoxyribose-phosphate aldolase
MHAVGRFAPYIDHTLLAPEATAAEIDDLCTAGARHGVAAVCVQPVWVHRAAERLEATPVAVASVVGFPSGAHEAAVKVAEAVLAVERGARELDLVVSLGAVRGGHWRYVEEEISAVVRETEGALVKVIIESALLSPQGIVRACQVARDSGAGFVKTSTGFHPRGGATAAAVRLMRQTVGDTIGVKAAGGISDCASAEAMFAAGATRIGSSRGAMLAECVGVGPRLLAALPPLSVEASAPTGA